MKVKSTNLDNGTELVKITDKRFTWEIIDGCCKLSRLLRECKATHANVVDENFVLQLEVQPEHKASLLEALATYLSKLSAPFSFDD